MESTKYCNVIKDLSKKYLITKTDVRILENGKWLIKIFKLKHFMNYVTIVKKHFDKKGLLMIEFSILNKKESVLNKNYDDLKSFTKELRFDNINIAYFNQDLLTTNQNKIIIETAKTLGWDRNQFIYQKITSSNQKNWIEKTIRLVRPEAFHVKYKIAQNPLKKE